MNSELTNELLLLIIRENSIESTQEDRRINLIALTENGKRNRYLKG